MRAIVLALLALLGLVAVGLALMVADRTLLGSIVMLLGLPAAFVIWLTISERS